MSSEKNTSPDNPHQSLKAHVQGYSEYTTAHGFARLASARGVSWHVFWIVILIGAHFAFYYHTYIIIQDYLQRPVRTKVTMKHGKSLAFPTVTFCNRNMLRRSKVPLDLINGISKMQNETKSATKAIRTTRKSPSGSALPKPENKHASQMEWEQLRTLYDQFTQSEKEEYGHQLQDMVLDCNYNGEDCNSNVQFDEAFTWRHVWLDEVGNCYMFNRALNNDGKRIDPYKSAMPGDSNGLKLLLNIEQYDYLDDVSPYAGIRIVIGKQGQMPFPLATGLDIAPGLSTNIELRMHHIARLDPFGNTSCEKSGKLKTGSAFQFYNMTYSKMACKISCLIAMQNARCQCAQFYSEELSLCDYKNSTVTGCLEDVYDEYLDGKCETYCPPPCSEFYFTTTISSSKWPSNNYIKRLNESLKTDYGFVMTKDEINDNLVELHIYFADLDYVQVEETHKYEIQDIMSNIGGQLGMWIGVSAVSIAEVIELCIIVVNFLINKNKFKSTVNVQRINVS